MTQLRPSAAPFRRRLAIAGAALAATVPGLLVASVPTAGSVAPQAPAVAHDHANHHHGPDGLDLDRGRRGAATPALAPYDVDRHAPWAASEWDGKAFTTDQADLVTGPKVHAIYVYPAKSTSRFLKFAAMFQADARQANALLETTRSRALRFDERRGDDGAAYLDITVFQSRYRASQLAGANQFSLVANELAASGKFSNPDKKYVAWLDAGSKYCGQGTLYQDPTRSVNNPNNVSRTTGIVYRPYADDATTGGFCRGRTLLHELGHNLGAVQPAAPHDFDGAHCNDSAEDVMCYGAEAEKHLGLVAADTGNAVFDHNSDDYWDPATAPLTWWTVNLSRFLCDGGRATC